MFQKDFKKGALPARKVSPLMPINSLINSEQIVNNSCSKNKNFSPLMPINCLIKCLINSEQIVNNSSSKQNQFVSPQQTVRVPNKMKAALMNPFMSILGEERRKSAPKKPTILSVFSAIRH